MFCPKCAAQNDDDQKFCRNCGQGLALVLRSMSAHASMTVAGSIDEFFDLSPRRLIRDSALWTIASIWVFVSAIRAWSEPTPDVFRLVLSVVVGTAFLVNALQAVLAYMIGSRMRDRPDPEPGLSVNIFCTRCGVVNTRDVILCSHCGARIDFHLDPHKSSWLRKRLERQFARSIDPTYLWGKNHYVIVAYFVFNGAMELLSGSVVGATSAFLLAGCFLPIIVWDGITRRRLGLPNYFGMPQERSLWGGPEITRESRLTALNLEGDANITGSDDSAATSRLGPTPHSVTEETTKPLGQTVERG